MIGDIKYTPEVIKFIKINSDKTSAWLSRKINKYFNLDTTPRGVQSCKQRYGIKRKPLWNVNIQRYIKRNFNTMSHSEMVKKLEYNFNLKTDIKTLSTMASIYGLKYNVKRDHKQIGTETIFKIGKKGNRNIIYIKYRDLPTSSKGNLEYKVNWKPKKNYIWEQYNGNIPNDYAIIQLDGDFTNCNIENLRAIPKSILPKITKLYGYGIITEAMIEILKLEEDINNAINN